MRLRRSCAVCRLTLIPEDDFRFATILMERWINSPLFFIVRLLVDCGGDGKFIIFDDARYIVSTHPPRGGAP